MKYLSDKPLIRAQDRLRAETASCNHADLPQTTAIGVLAAISRYAADQASVGNLDDTSVLAALKFIRDWSGGIYEELAAMIRQGAAGRRPNGVKRTGRPKKGAESA